MTHHEKLYPPTDMLSDEYRSAGKDSTVWIFAGLSLPVLAIPVVAYLFGIIGLVTALGVLGEMVLLGWLHDHVHDSFHVKGHWLRKVPLLNKLHARFEKLHYIHHVDMSKNFGIFFSLWDKLFKTLKSE
jgi:sterol desaturase/sphingolipid hydroxylase (fatty acid hydroxylase superfamily)